MQRVLGILAALTLSMPAHAQENADLIAIAEAQGACGVFGVASANRAPDGSITVVCNEDATAFAPLLGGLAPTLGIGLATALAAALAGGNSTPNTQ